MGIHPIARVIAIVAALMLAPLAAHAAPAQPPAPTLFGHGPELYISPDRGAVPSLEGTRISVVGLGYRPGAAVRVFLIGLGSGYGADTVTRFTVARAVVERGGRFATSFRFRLGAFPAGTGYPIIEEAQAAYGPTTDTIVGTAALFLVSHEQ